MSGVLRWEDPPPNPRRSSRWAGIAEALRLRPGEWAVVETKTGERAGRAAANNIKAGAFVGMKAGEFEAACRRVDGEYRVYARYVGEPS